MAYFLVLAGFIGSGSVACEFASGSSGGGGGGSGSGILYLLDNQNTQVDIFSNASGLSGTLTISQSITGDPDNLNTNPSFTYMQNPTALAIDYVRDILYVADTNQQAILAFTNAHSANGQVSATRVYPYALINGNISGNVVDLFYDANNDILYAADALQQTVFRWTGISTIPLPNDQNPTGQIYLGFVMSSITVDLSTVGNLLYVGNPLAKAVQMYNGLLTLSTNDTNPPTASKIFTENPTDTATNGFVTLSGLAVNPTVVSGGILYVSEEGYPSIEIFNDASSLQNAQDPTAEIAGVATGLVKNQSSKLLVNPNTNALWVIAGNALVNIWNNAQQIDPANTNQAPSVSLAITDAGQLVDLALDTTR